MKSVSRWFEVNVHSMMRTVCSVRAETLEEASDYAKELYGNNLAWVTDLTGLPEDMELLHAGFTKEYDRRREWLVLFRGQEIHVYEVVSEIAPGACRFRGSVPGYSRAGFSVEAAVLGAASRDAAPADWFTRSVLDGKPYIATSYVPSMRTESP